jgi:hypothetical protein
MKAFITSTELKDRLGYELVSANATLCVDGACALIRSATGQSFSHIEEEVIALDGSGTDVVLLPQLPVEEVKAVKVNGEAVEDWRFYDKSGILARVTTAPVSCATWPKGRQNVEVTYSYGYEQTDVPAEVRLLALTIAARLYQQGIVASETVGTTQVTYSTDSLTFTKGEQAIIDRYRFIRRDSTQIEAGS